MMRSLIEMNSQSVCLFWRLGRGNQNWQGSSANEWLAWIDLGLGIITEADGFAYRASVRTPAGRKTLYMQRAGLHGLI